MKIRPILIGAASFIAVLPLQAGTQEVISEPAPPMTQSPMWEWFVGASGGYLLDLEEGMYHAHVGVNTPMGWSGWSTALYLEVGFVETEDLTSIVDPTVPTAVVTAPFSSELQVVPVTLNFKLERAVTDWLNLYAGIGVGAAFTEFDGYAPLAAGPPIRVSDDDVVFYAQAFAGVGFDVGDHFEIFTGARWIYLDDPEFTVGPSTGAIDFEDDVLVEAGFRFTF